MDIKEYIEKLPMWADRKNPIADIYEFLSAMGLQKPEAGVIHIAGTNGKGSVTAYMSRALTDAGYKVGSFISPHLVNLNERIMIDSVPVDDNTLSNAGQYVRLIAEKMTESGFFHPAFFEFLFYTAMKIFHDEKVDYIVLETGMGGRLDATNAIREKELTVITSISLDHTAYLGTSVADIAAEKAGILRADSPLVYDDTNREAAALIEKRAAELGIRSIFRLSSEAEHKEFEEMNAAYKRRNARLALLALRALQYPEFDEASAVKSVSSAIWRGRMQEIEENIFTDGAHNGDGIREFSIAASEICAKRNKSPVIIFSAVSDKDIASMIKILYNKLKPLRMYIARLNSYRASDEEETAAEMEKEGNIPVFTFTSVKSALEAAKKARKEDEIVFAVGSLYMVGEILGGMNDKF